MIALSAKNPERRPKSLSEMTYVDDLVCEKTGIPGLDELLDNRGIPNGYTVAVIGSPGAGKTTLSMQFLYNGIKMYGERGIYVSLDENLNSLRKAMRAVGIDIKDVINEGLSLVDATHLRSIPKEVQVGAQILSKGEFSLLSLTESIRARVEETGAKRIVIDPLAMLTIIYPNETDRRIAVADLIHQLSTMGATTLVLTELHSDGARRSYQIEDYLSQGVILMRKMMRQDEIFYVVQIEKMRGIDHETQPRLYKLEKGGITVLPRKSLNST